MLADYRAGLDESERGRFDRTLKWPFERFLMWMAYNAGNDALSAVFTNYASSNTAGAVERLTAAGVRIPVEYYYHYIDAMDDAMCMCDSDDEMRSDLEYFMEAWDENQALPESAIAPLDPEVPTDEFIEPGSLDFNYLFENPVHRIPMTSVF